MPDRSVGQDGSAPVEEDALERSGLGPPKVTTRSSFDRKYRNAVRRDTPASAATSSIPAYTFAVEAGVGRGRARLRATFAPVWASHTHRFNWLGLPAVSVPCGFLDGLPVGLQVVGLPGCEATILRAAHAFQQAFPQPARPPAGEPP